MGYTHNRRRTLASIIVIMCKSLTTVYLDRRLLECLLVLLSSPQTCTDPAVFAGVRDLLLYFVSFQQGMIIHPTSFITAYVPSPIRSAAVIW